MLEIYEVVIDTHGYAAIPRFPDQFQTEATPSGLFVHTPTQLLEKMGVGSGIGVDGARNCLSVVSLSHTDETKTIFDFTEYCTAVAQRKIPGLRIHTESHSFVAPLVAMRRTAALSMEAILYVYPAEASSMTHA